MQDPSLVKETEYKQHETTSKLFHSHKRSTGSLLADPASRETSPQPDSAAEAYNSYGGRGTKKTRAAKLRDICGRRAPSADFQKTVEKIVKQEQRPKPHKRQISDGQGTLDFNKNVNQAQERLNTEVE